MNRSSGALFFPTPGDFRRWLEENHQTATELLVGLHRREAGRPSITWPEAVDQALCFGWIDGVRRRIDETSYSIRFTPRKPRSTWSTVNIGRVRELTAGGLMHPAGLAAFERRTADRSAIYAYEQRRTAQLTPDQEARFRESSTAWEHFAAQPAWYRRTAAWWVLSAKREQTRESRLATLIEESEHGRTVRPLRRPGPSET